MTPEELRRRGRTIWQRMPPEVEALVHREGNLQPIGLVSYGEGETRTLSEVLGKTVLLERDGLLEAGTVRGPIVRMVIDRLEDHLRGWYGLHDAAAFVAEAAVLLEGSTDDDALQVVEEIALYVGRISMWLDLLLPWNQLNETMVRELESGFGEALASTVGDSAPSREGTRS
jgi:hypothetical protein